MLATISLSLLWKRDDNARLNRIAFQVAMTEHDEAITILRRLVKEEGRSELENGFAKAQARRGLCGQNGMSGEGGETSHRFSSSMPV